MKTKTKQNWFDLKYSSENRPILKLKDIVQILHERCITPPEDECADNLSKIETEEKKKTIMRRFNNTLFNLSAHVGYRPSRHVEAWGLLYFVMPIMNITDNQEEYEQLEGRYKQVLEKHTKKPEFLHCLDSFVQEES